MTAASVSKGVFAFGMCCRQSGQMASFASLLMAKMTSGSKINQLSAMHSASQPREILGLTGRTSFWQGSH